MATPYIAANWKATRMVAHRAKIGMMLERYPRASPLMMTGAGPYLVERAMSWTGEDRDDVGEVSKGKSFDDDGGGAVLGGAGDVLDGGVGVGGVVFGGSSNDEAGPEAHSDASEDF